ncbi:Serine/threonine-protein kinase PrkC [Rubripirellula tenax]|uniref:non-specific serine/threonine protein kinase n=1 Tax=Rubripirellula tenax TaxID=2528015 RepID=A0A5C6FAB7_9BACT|nr:serine/threonine-protein kinase [Rubripirellula tenax]TWU56491.1 Serine/threonine-protein kinase PrkC [Rubripirellula tenax]
MPDESIDNDDLDQPTIVGPKEDSPSEDRSGASCGFASIGSIVGQYELLGEIARGGMGVVYRARHQRLGRLAAIKMILDPDEAGDRAHDRFDTEAKAAATLDHPGIVSLFESGHWNGYPYFAMAYVDGKSLSDELRSGPLKPVQAANLAASISDAMAHAHDRHIVHRDLKPANILIDEKGQPHITDFGVCKDLSASSELTTAGELVGTPHYMPPEQAGMAGVPLGPAADVYSIGAVLFAMLTGRPPFLAATPIEVVSQVLTQDPVSPRALNASVPIELSTIAMKCLRKNAKQRYPHAKDLADDLHRFLKGEPILARPPSLIDRFQILLRRHVFVASVSSTGALALIAMMLFLFVSLTRTRDNLATTQIDLDKVEAQLKSERITVARFLRTRSVSPSGTDPIKVIQQFEMDRIVDAHLQATPTHPDLAMELAVEAAKWSVSNDLELPENIFDFLRNEVMRQQPSDAAAERKKTSQVVEGSDLYAELEDASASDRSILDKLIDVARKQIVKPMSNADRRLFGLRVDEKPDTDETQL